MELSSHVSSNLDQWVESGYITAEQREDITQLILGAVQDAYEVGLANADYDNEAYADGYDDGFDSGYDAAKNDLSSDLKNEWFEQGWAEALLEHGIEE
jgi:hypothetical protein